MRGTRRRRQPLRPRAPFPSAKRRAYQQLHVGALREGEAAQQRSVDRTRAHRVYPYTAAGELDRHRLRQHHHSPLRRAVSGVVRRRADPGDRCQVDDGSGRGQQRGEGRLAQQERPGEVDLDDLTPLVNGKLRDRMRRRDPRRVDQHIESPEAGNSLGDRRGARRGVGHITLERCRSRQHRGGLLSRVGVAIEAHHDRTFRRESLRDGAADSTGGSRDQCDLAGESLHRNDGTRRTNEWTRR
jgi:hypothetical protein